MPVGSYEANNYGLYDMHGNVSEWCNDWYGEYPIGNVTDPQGASSGSNRVNRGGCGINSRVLRSADRCDTSPSDSSSGRGFRLIKVL